MGDEIADGTEQSRSEQQLAHWFVSMTKADSYYLHGCPSAPALPGRIGSVLAGEGAGCVGILEMKGRIDRDPVFASPRLPLSIVAGRLGPLIEFCTFIPEGLLGKRRVQITLGTDTFGTNRDGSDATQLFHLSVESSFSFCHNKISVYMATLLVMWKDT